MVWLYSANQDRRGDRRTKREHQIKINWIKTSPRREKTTGRVVGLCLCCGVELGEAMFGCRYLGGGIAMG